MSLGPVLKPALPGKNVWLIKSTLLGKKFSTMHTVNYHSEKCCGKVYALKFWCSITSPVQIQCYHCFLKRSLFKEAFGVKRRLQLILNLNHIRLTTHKKIPKVNEYLKVLVISAE